MLIKDEEKNSSELDLQIVKDGWKCNVSKFWGWFKIKKYE